MINVLIADDYPVTREGLRRILDGAAGISVTGEAASCREVLERIGQNDYDVVLLDIGMPDQSGLDILHQLKQEKLNLQVLILSGFSERSYAIRALKGKADGYLEKTASKEELIAAVHKVYEGKKYISASLAEQLATDISVGFSGPPHEQLSNREYSIMCLIASGNKLADIARELSISPKTVSTYKSRILNKMNMTNCSELTLYAMNNQLIK